MNIADAFKVGIDYAKELLARAEGAENEDEKIQLTGAAIHAASHTLNVVNDIRVGKQIHADTDAEKFKELAIPEHLKPVVDMGKKPEAV